MPSLLVVGCIAREMVCPVEKILRFSSRAAAKRFLSFDDVPQSLERTNTSLTIFKMASIGTAKLAPGTAHIQNQNTSDRMTSTAFNSFRM